MRVQSAKEQLAIDKNSRRLVLDLLSVIVSITEMRWNRMNNAVSALKKLLEVSLRLILLISFLSNTSFT